MPAVKISVVVPVYNGAAFLRQTLDALDRQTFRDFEAILVDDGSTDGSGRLMDEYCAGHPRFRVLHLANGGAHAARLAGIREARGAFVAFCDSDDLPLPAMLQTLCERAEETGADVTVCGFLREEMGTGRVLSREMTRFEPRAYDRPELWDVLPVVNTALWNKLYRRELLDRLLPLDAPCRVAEDVMFLCALYPAMRRMAFVPEPLYRYRVRPGSAFDRVSDEDVRSARANLELLRDQALREDGSREMSAYLDALAFILFGWSMVIRQVRGSVRSRAAVRSARAWLKARFPGYKKAGRSLLWNLSHHMLQGKLLVGRWIFCAHMMGPFLMLYDLITRKLKREIKW